MTLGGMLCLRIYVFILVVEFSLLMLSNGEKQQQLSIGEEKYFSGEFKLHGKPATNTAKTKNTSIGIDQTRSHDGSSSSMAEKKTLNVRMKSLFQGNRELSVYDSKELIYYIDHSQVHTHNKEVWLLNDNGEIVFKIRPKVFINMNRRHVMKVYEGHRGPGSTAVSSNQRSFRVQDIPGGNSLQMHLDRCKAIYDGNQYWLIPCKIEKSSNAKVDLKIMTTDGKTIAELKLRQVDRRGIPLGNDTLKLEVEQDADVSFVVALVAVFGRINNIL